ncbi:MAG: hypothetical protein Q9228_006708 [Teloschistes exilis]
MPTPPWFESENDLGLTAKEVPRHCKVNISKKISKPRSVRRSDRIRKRTQKKALPSLHYHAAAGPTLNGPCHLEWANYLRLLSSVEETTTDEFRLPALSLEDLWFDDLWYCVKESFDDSQVEQAKVVKDELKGFEIEKLRVVEDTLEEPEAG